MDFIKKNITKIKEKGLIKTITMMYRIPFFFFYKYLFMSCKRIYVSGEFQIRGKKYIQIGSFSAGSRIRIDAIKSFGVQLFNPHIKVGDNVIGNNDIHIACTGNITIGNKVLFASNIYLTDHDHGIYSNFSNLPISSPGEQPSYRLLTEGGSISIGDNVFIGEYVTILKNVKIGEGCIIGAHSLVSKNIPPFSIASGNPAKVIKKYNFDSCKWEKC
jgi:lipopolysaccharide O-acetyltransferase